jgi:hypothetical protein
MLTAEIDTPALEISTAGVRARRPASPPTLLMLLLAADALFVILHVSQLLTPFVQDPRFSVELDRGFAETYQYVKEYWAALLLLLVGLRLRTPLYVGWALVFVYLLADDAFMLHERLGAALAPHLPLPAALPVGHQHVGEAVVLGAVGGLALALIAVLSVAADARARRASGRLLQLAALLAFFGVGVDLLHATVASGSWHAALGVVEDAGEMVVLSVQVSVVAALRDGAGDAARPDERAA